MSLRFLYFFANHCYFGLGPLGMLRNTPNQVGWGRYVTNAQPSRLGMLRNIPSQEAEICYVTSPACMRKGECNGEIVGENIEHPARSYPALLLLTTSKRMSSKRMFFLFKAEPVVE
jgi:hypothetical protein